MVSSVPNSATSFPSINPESKDSTFDTQIRRNDLAEFLRRRRETLSPLEVGLIPPHGRRRTPGLRREEVAEIAGVGTTWYTWLEQARDIKPSTEVLMKVGRALHLNSVELDYILRLGTQGSQAGGPEMVEPEAVTFYERNQAAMSLVQTMTALIEPAIMLDSLWNVVATNVAAQRVQSLVPTDSQCNWLHHILISESLKSEMGSMKAWENFVRRMIAEWRLSLAARPVFREETDLIDRLLVESAVFKDEWNFLRVAPALPVQIDFCKRQHSQNGQKVLDGLVSMTKFKRVVLQTVEDDQHFIFLFARS